MQADCEQKSDDTHHFSEVLLSVLVICALTWGIYYSSLSVPFYLDDYSSITNNPRFEGASVTSILNDYGLRVLGYLGLWLNYEYAKLDVFSYHIVNVVIHMLTGIAVFFLTLKLIQISKTIADVRHQLIFAAIVALIFVSHPLQSQGVTYIVQRLASQVALFYVASIACYIYLRTAHAQWQRIVFAFLCLAFALCAMLTKQNAFTLPVVIIMTEWVLFNSIKRKHVIVIAALAGAIGLVALIFYQTSVSFFSTLDALTRETKDITRLDYFLAQQPILWEYILKVFWPWPLQLEYDLTVTSFPLWAVVLSAVANAGVLFVAIVFRRQFVLAAWGILFYYVAHSVESSIIPIRDIVFEHRTYLPNIGIFIAVSAIFYSLADNLLDRGKVKKTVAILAPLSIIILLACLTVLRNQQWQEPEVFFAHDLKLAPEQPRAIHNYAEYKLKTGNVAGATDLLERLFTLKTDKIDGNMLNTYLAAMIAQKKYSQALERAHSVLERPISISARSIINSNIGVIYTNLKRYNAAMPYFKKAHSQGLVPSNSLIAYAYSSFVLKKYTLSEKLCREILAREPQHERALLLLTVISNKN